MDIQELKEIALRYKDEILMPYDSMIDVIGFEAICAMSDEFHGSSIYVPHKKKIFGKCLREQIIREFDGDYAGMAKRFDYCERQVRDIIREAKKHKY